MGQRINNANFFSQIKFKVLLFEIIHKQKQKHNC